MTKGTGQRLTGELQRKVLHWNEATDVEVCIHEVCLLTGQSCIPFTMIFQKLVELYPGKYKSPKTVRNWLKWLVGIGRIIKHHSISQDGRVTYLYAVPPDPLPPDDIRQRPIRSPQSTMMSFIGLRRLLVDNRLFEYAGNDEYKMTMNLPPNLALKLHGFFNRSF